MVIHEGTLIDICDLLGADRFELVDARVTLYKRHPQGAETSWSGYLGDQIAADGSRWKVSTELQVETTWASVA